MEQEKQFYIVLSQTGTILSKILKFVTKAPYNHASVSFEGDLSTMYSFGRKNAYNPYVGGFVKESIHFGTFKRFSNASIKVINIPLENAQVEAMENYVLEMFENRKKYKYNYFGLWLASFNIVSKRENAFYCSEFVLHVLEKFNLASSSDFNEIIKPIEFLQIESGNVVYEGTLSEISNKNKHLRNHGRFESCQLVFNYHSQHDIIKN